MYEFLWRQVVVLDRVLFPTKYIFCFSPIVSGLDSATSLIQAAKNLMNAVVLTVKASYVASTKYPRQAIAEGINSKPVVVWKMKVNCKMKKKNDTNRQTYYYYNLTKKVTFLLYFFKISGSWKETIGPKRPCGRCTCQSPKRISKFFTRPNRRSSRISWSTFSRSRNNLKEILQ